VQLPALPLVGWQQLGALVPAALGLALVVYDEGLGAADAIATRHGEQVRPNQELLELGGANAASGLFQGRPDRGGPVQVGRRQPRGRRRHPGLGPRPRPTPS